MVARSNWRADRLINVNDRRSTHFLAVGCSLRGVVGVGSAEARCALCPRQERRAGPPSAPACLSIPTTPPHGTHTFNPQGGQSNQQRFSILPIFKQKSRHDTSFVPATACQVLKGKESDLRSNFPMTSLSARAVSGTIADYITLRSLRNLSNESKGPLNTANQSEAFIL